MVIYIHLSTQVGGKDGYAVRYEKSESGTQSDMKNQSRVRNHVHSHVHRPVRTSPHTQSVLVVDKMPPLQYAEGYGSGDDLDNYLRDLPVPLPSVNPDLRLLGFDSLLKLQLW